MSWFRSREGEEHLSSQPRESNTELAQRQLHEEARRELVIMLRYVLAEGKELDDKTRLDAAPAVEGKTDFSQLIAAHMALARIVAPATPRSLKATEPEKGLLKSIRPTLILVMIWVAILSTVGFVVTSVIAAPTNSSTTEKRVTTLTSYSRWPDGRLHLAGFIPVADTDKPSASEKASLGVPPEAPPWLKQLNWCFAAALGAVFYVLFTAHEYVKGRTFDPRYNSLYLIRFVLGVLAGLILANVLSAPRFGDNSTLRSLGPAVAGLLGGFSSEAVYQVLQRLVEIMLAAVRGDNSDAAKAKASETARQELISLASDPSIPQALLTKVHAAIQKVG
jgi:hypothetical protein